MPDKILVYGNPDKSEGFGFPTVEAFRDWIRDRIFTEKHGRYRYTDSKEAQIIVLSRDGEAHGHFVISGRSPIKAEEQEFDKKLKSVYLVDKSCLYAKAVRLSQIGITGLQWGKPITTAQFESIRIAAEEVTAFYDKRLAPDSPVELEQRLRLIRDRLGQTAFKKVLLDAYGCCAVTGCDAEAALEAAHIDPYSESACNEVSNGLLLRADIHSLFDKILLAINPDTFTVILSPTLQASSYAELQGKPLAMPTIASNHPSRDALKRRWERFEHARESFG